MKLSEFDFEIPQELVAQRPLEKRNASRMLVVDRNAGSIEHRLFLDLPSYLTPKDTLVFNRSRVIKARLIGERASGGKVEIFLLRKLSDGLFECLVKATAAKKEGLEVSFGEGLRATVLYRVDNSMMYVVRLAAPTEHLDVYIEKVGRMPLPPYIRREADGLDVSRYQTVYAEQLGSVAAPTAGLHFTPEIMTELEGKGVRLDYVTLHVGLGTFQPIKVDDVEDHKMHTEFFEVSRELRERSSQRRQSGERTIAVGTTSVRALESAARGIEEATDLFLKPGSDFLWVDALFTNFHQPKSSLAVMLTAFLGSRELFQEAYRTAVEARYRFFSYGDCMLVL